MLSEATRLGMCEFILRPLHNLELQLRMQKAIEAFRLRAADDSVVQKMFACKLTQVEEKILGQFIASPNGSISRECISKRVWPEQAVHPKALDVHLFNLRQKLGPKGYSLSSSRTGQWQLIKQDIKHPESRQEALSAT